jgi:hypothetical protein
MTDITKNVMFHISVDIESVMPIYAFPILDYA